MRIESKLKLRENKFIRTICYPYKNYLINYEKKEYQKKGYPERLKNLCNSHVGDRCFIIGNGPSLTVNDLERLEGETTFAANRIYRLYDQTDWRPTFWLCVDPYILENDQKIISGLEGTKLISYHAKKLGVESSETTYFIFNYQPYRINKYSAKIKVEFSEDISKYFVAGETVTYNSIQLAVYMGYKEIYLIGVDHSYSQSVDSSGKLCIDKSIKDYFGNIKTECFNIQNSVVSTAAYISAYNYCLQNGIKVFNATRGGKLEVFPRVSLDDILGKP